MNAWREMSRRMLLAAAVLAMCSWLVPSLAAQVPPPPNTSTGTNVTVSPTDDTPSFYIFPYQPVTLTFANVTVGGDTHVRTRYDLTPPPPKDPQTNLDMQTGSPASYFDLTTTAIYDQILGIDACFDIRGMAFANPAAVSLYQLQNGSWVSLASTLTSGVKVCAHFATLGSFALFYAQVPQTKIATIAGTGFARNSIDGPGGDPRDDANDGGPATSAAISPVKAVLDHNRGVLYVTDLSVFPDPGHMGSYIRTIDLNTGIITTLLGVPEIAYSLALDSTGDLYFTAGCQVRKFSFATTLVSTVAGTGACGFGGDGLDATVALIQPFRGQIAFDPSGNLFIADQLNATIRRVDKTTSLISTVAGNGTTTSPVSGSLPTQTGIGQPTGLALDNHGALLISNGSQLMRISPGANNTVDGGSDEILTVLAGCVSNCQPVFFGRDGQAISTQTRMPGEFLSMASDGAVLVTEQSNMRIRRIDPGADHVVTGASDEIIWTVAGFRYPITNGIGIFNGDTFSTQSTLAAPSLALEDLTGNLLIMDGNNNRVRGTGYSPLLPGGSPTTADLSITATATPNPASTGNLLTYGPIAVSNAGPVNATGVALNFVLPQNATFQSVTTSQGTCSSPAVDSTGTVNCALGTLAQGAATVTVTVKPQSVGPLAATISVMGNEVDPNPSNNVVNLSTTVNQGAAVINVTETIQVTDAPGILPSAMIPVAENITVTDSPGVLPSAMIPVAENIVVTDTPSLLPSAMIPVNENITVTDVPNVATPNMPPVVTPPAGITIAATQIDGARGNASAALHSFLLGGTATDDTDPAPQRQSPQADFGAGLVDVNDLTVFPVGTTPVRFAYRDKDGATGTASANVTVTPPVGGVVGTGGQIIVTPADLQNLPQPIELIFASVTQPGLATATPVNPVPPPPGLQFVGPVFDINTTALFNPPVIVCFLGNGFTPSDQLWHAGVLIGTTINTPTRICAQSSSLSPFGVVRPADNPPTANAGTNQTLEATSPGGANVTLSGSGTDPDNDPLTFAWSSATCGNANGQSATLLCPLGTNTVTLTVSDGRGGAASSTVVITVRDTIVPKIVCASPDAAWHATDVSISCTATDSGSGLANSGDASFALSTSVAPNTETSAAQTGSLTVCDLAGNCSVGGPIGPIKVDKKGPAITFSTPANGSVYILNQSATANFSCSDAGSGLASCSGTVASGSAIDTSSVGSKSLRVTATDAAGNKTSVTNTYTVVYRQNGGCAGDVGHQILQPINADGSSVWKQGSTVPAKFRVCDFNGVSIGTAGVIKNFVLYQINGGTIAPIDESASSSTNDLAWHFDSTARQWIFNLSTKTAPQNVANQTYYYRIDLNDGTSIFFQFGLK